MSDRKAKTPLLETKPSRALWTLAWPVLTLGFLRSAMFLADSAWVGLLGPEALSGQAGASFASWIMHAWADLASIGLLALIARAVGAKEETRVGVVLTQGLWVALVLGAGLVFASGSLPSVYFRLLGYIGTDFGPALDAGESYLTVLMMGGPTLVFFLVVHATFRGLGDTRTPLAIAAAAVLLNLGLDPVFMFGLGPVPALGIKGAALATVTADGIGAPVGFIVLAKRGYRPRFLAPSVKLIGTILRISAPMAVAGLAAQGATRIDTAQSVSVTFPTFVELMRSIGAQMDVEATQTTGT